MNMTLEKKIPPVVLLLIHVVFIFALARLPGPRFPGAVVDVLSVVFMAGALLVILLSLRQFKSVSTTVNPLNPEKASTLVVNGIYRISRNPMYLAMLLILLSIMCWTHSFLALVAIPSFIVVMNKLQIEAEEVALESLFGADYRDYCDQVRRWI